VVSPLDQEWVYGLVPPLTVVDIVPFAFPLQVTLLNPEIAAFKIVGSVISTVSSLVHPFRSVTVTIYEFAARPVAVIVV